MTKFYKRVRSIILILLLIWSHSATSQALLDPLSQPKFVNPLPIPPVVNATAGGTHEFTISQFEQHLGLINPITKQPLMTKVWGYNGKYPGPTIVARKNVTASFFFYNKLVGNNNKPLEHLLPIDESVHWAFMNELNWKQYGIPIVTHLHGGHTESASDGLPEAWYTPNFSRKGPHFIKGDMEPYTYHNTQEAATLWYHDHAMGITRLNAYAGLAGFYLVKDDVDDELVSTNKLPGAPYDIGLAIQDKMFTADGQLYYPSAPPTSTAPATSILPEMFGNVAMVNGMAWPVLNVEPRPYRFRLLNASDSRVYDLFLSSGNPLVVIASDDGLLQSPVSFSSLLLAPGERKEVVIDFSNPRLWGQTIILRNTGKTPFPKGAACHPHTVGQIMAFNVNVPLNSEIAKSKLPSTLREPIPRLTTDLPARKLILFETMDEYDRMKPMLGTFEEGIKEFHDPITENPALNSTEIWEIYNETPDAHPIHLHQVAMQLISRQRFFATIDGMTGKPSNVRLMGMPKGPAADETGWKDTYLMYPGEVTRIIAKFDLPGLYAWHCHILSHEDNEMMRPFFVGAMESPHGNTLVEEPTASTRLNIQTIPNPFNSQLKILLPVSTTAKVSVRLLNATGKIVQQIFNGQLPVGMHQFTIEGSKLSNGTYLCEIWVNNQREIRKVLLQK